MVAIIGPSAESWGKLRKYWVTVFSSGVDCRGFVGLSLFREPAGLDTTALVEALAKPRSVHPNGTDLGRDCASGPVTFVSAIHVLTAPLDGGRRGTLVFDGSLVVLKDLAPLQDFARTSADLLARAFDTSPEQAHLELPRAEFDRRVSEVVRWFRRDPAVAEAFREVLQHAGVDVGDAFWDWLHLRVQPPREFALSGTLGWHRDTWASNVYAQTNWWTPILPVGPERTIAFCPAYWSRPLANNSAEWDVARVAELPPVPVPVDQPNTDSETRIVIEPGDLLCFSGAHLHASVSNTTDRTRFSLEVRTVAGIDVRTGRGAPNVDGRAPRAAWHWFRAITSGESLADLAEPAGPGPRNRTAERPAGSREGR